MNRIIDSLDNYIGNIDRLREGARRSVPCEDDIPQSGQAPKEDVSPLCFSTSRGRRVW
jgi:hypothetical protein